VLPVAEHTRSENPYRLIYAALGISEPGGPAPSLPAVIPKASRPSTLTSRPVWRKAWQNSPRRCPPQAKPAAAVVEAWARDKAYPLCGYLALPRQDSLTISTASRMPWIESWIESWTELPSPQGPTP